MGKPVVSTELESLKPYSKVVSMSQNHEEFIKQIEISMNQNNSELTQQRIDTVKENTCKRRAERLMNLMV